MVFKNISSFSRYSSTKSNASHSFFDPSYISSHRVTVVDGLLGTGARNSSTAHPRPSISTSSSFIVFDPSFLQNNNNNNNNNSNDNNNDNRSPRILLKKSSHKVNKNGHVNLSLESISGQFATLSLRRSNATNTKTIKINKDDFINANYKTNVLPSSTPKEAVESTEEAKLLVQKEVAEEVEKLLPEEDLLDNNEFLNINYRLMEKYASQGKNNEILALYNNLKDRPFKLTLNIYNAVLQSIPLRYNVKETTEENMTLLLNVYSDMILNGIKPNQRIYQNVILPLLNASIKSYLSKDTDQAEQYFKIANELFNVSLASSCQYTTDLYEKLLVCYNLLKFSGVQVRSLAKIMHNKLGSQNVLYYLGLLNLCKHSKDPKFAIQLYTEFKSVAASYPQLLKHQLQVYSSLIRTLVSCNKVDTAAGILDQLIINIRSESGMSKDILPLLSAFVISLAEIGLVEQSYQVVEKFDAIPWLPKLQASSLMLLVDNACNFNEIEYAIKFWEWAVVKEDFDFSVSHANNNLINLIENVSSVETKSTFTKLVKICFVYDDKRSLVRLSKELLLKDSLQVDIPILVEMTKFLFDNGLPKLAIEVISNQGSKLNSDSNINEYLSSLIDVVPKQYYLELVSSSLFKAAVDNYSLINDNIYGIHKVLTSIWGSPSIRPDDKVFGQKLNYSYSVLLEELNDLNNFYVEIPQEIKNFKKSLEKRLE